AMLCRPLDKSLGSTASLALPSLAHEGRNLEIVSIVADIHAAADSFNRRRLFANWLRRRVLNWLSVAHDLGDVLNAVGNVGNRARALGSLRLFWLCRSHRLRLGKRRLLRLFHPITRKNAA